MRALFSGVALAAVLAATPALAVDYRMMQASFTHPDTAARFRITLTYSSGNPDKYEAAPIAGTDGVFRVAIMVDRSRKCTATVQAVKDGVMSAASNAVVLDALPTPAAPVLQSIQ